MQEIAPTPKIANDSNESLTTPIDATVPSSNIFFVSYSCGCKQKNKRKREGKGEERKKKGRAEICDKVEESSVEIMGSSERENMVQEDGEGDMSVFDPLAPTINATACWAAEPRPIKPSRRKTVPHKLQKNSAIMEEDFGSLETDFKGEKNVHGQVSASPLRFVPSPFAPLSFR